MARLEGGRAFPSGSEARATHNQGMFLRDYFAGQALAGQIAYAGAEGCGGENGSADVAAWCYELADAMIRERVKP